MGHTRTNWPNEWCCRRRLLLAEKKHRRFGRHAGESDDHTGALDHHLFGAVAYLRLPDQAAYLLPIVPAFLFIAARSFPRPLFQLACIGLLFSAWIDFSPAGLHPGSIFSDHEERQKTLSDVTRFVRFAEEVLPGRNVVVVGGWQPMIDLLEPREKLHNDYRGLLSQRELQEARSAGSQVAYAGEMIRAFNFRTTGLDLAQAGGVDLRKLRIAMSR